MSLRRYLPRFSLLIFLVVALLSLGSVLTAYQLQQRELQIRFDRIADRAAERLAERLSEHIALIRATNGYFESREGAVTQAEFERYIQSLGLQERYSGILGLGFGRLISPADIPAVEEDLSRDYGGDLKIHPVPGDPDARMSVVALLEPMGVRNRSALGYDMMSEARRRVALEAAIDKDRPIASAPVELVQEITTVKQAGLLIYMPTRVRGEIIGFAYAAFRAGDLHKAALGDVVSNLPISLTTVDMAAPDLPLYESPLPAQAHAFGAERLVYVGGRQWRITMHATEEFFGWRDWLPTLLVGLMAVALSALSGLAALAYRRHAQQLVETARLHQEMAEDRRLLLQELRHRIKNHIARIQGIVRFTQRQSDSLPEFNALLNDRLMAMGRAQDLLVDGDGRGTDLRTLLQSELSQIGRRSDESSLDGPDVALSPRETQALGLVIHELMTNALKYAAKPDGTFGLEISWTLKQTGATRQVEIQWREQADLGDHAQDEAGFGSGLIDGLIEGDLNGSITRDLTPGGLHATLLLNLTRE